MTGHQVSLRITSGPKPNGVVPLYDVTDEKIITLEHLRQRALIALSNVCRSRPKFFSQPCPQLWMNHEGNIVEASYGSVLPAPRLGDDTRYFLVDYTRFYNYNPDPYISLGLAEDSDEEDDSMRSDFVDCGWLTKYSDGSLFNHIRYLMSVLWYEDDANLWGKICKLFLDPHMLPGTTLTPM